MVLPPSCKGLSGQTECVYPKGWQKHGRGEAPGTSVSFNINPTVPRRWCLKRGRTQTWQSLQEAEQLKVVKKKKCTYLSCQITADGVIWREINIKAGKASNSSCQLSRTGAAERSAQELDRNCTTAMFDNNQTCLRDRWWRVTCCGEPL